MSQLAQTDLGTFDPPTPAFSAGSDTAAGATSNLETFLSTTLGIMTIIGGVFFLIYFIIGALSWLTAGGDAGQVQKARDKMVMSVIGLAVLIMAYGLVGLIGSVLGLEILRPGAEILKLVPSTTP